MDETTGHETRKKCTECELKQENEMTDNDEDNSNSKGK